MSEIFVKASRLKLKFPTEKGVLTVEQLWDLPLTSDTGRTNLDDIARYFHKRLKNDDNVSFVDPARKSDDIIQLSFDIVKYIIDVKLEERKKASEEKDRADKKQKLLHLISEKQDETLRSKSIEDLKKELASL